MQKLIGDFKGVLCGFVIWWAAAVLIGMLMFYLWPPGRSYTAGIALEPQNVPGNLLGFIMAMYVFRAATQRPESITMNESSKPVRSVR